MDMQPANYSNTTMEIFQENLISEKEGLMAFMLCITPMEANTLKNSMKKGLPLEHIVDGTTMVTWQGKRYSIWV